MKKEHFKLEDYQVSSETGFLLANPKTELPPSFEAWQKIATSLPELYRSKKLRNEVHKLHLLDYTKLEGNQQLFLAHMQLAFISSAYVWQDGDSGVAKVLPETLAIPLYQISRKLGVKPITSHIDACLSNWNLIDPSGPLELKNLKCVHSIPGGKQGDHFCLVTALVELKFAKCVKHIVSILNLLLKTGEKNPMEKEEERSLLTNLKSIANSIGEMQKAFALMSDGLDAATFFNEIRPFLAGWGGPNSPLPDGLIFEGVSEEPFQIQGGSAAQSTTLQLLDAFFGVTHSDGEKKFLREMRHFMPPWHARFIEDTESSPVQLASYVKSFAGPAVRDAYNQCLAAIIDFRSFHVGIVSKYILRPSREINKKKYKSLDEQGTGGSDLIPFLKKIQKDTKNKVVGSTSKFNTMFGVPLYVLAFAICLFPVIIAFLFACY